MYKNIKFIHHHLGMGDHISCHGIVRHYCEITPEVGLFVKEHNFDNVQYMYNDIRNLQLFKMDDYQAINFLEENNIDNVLRVGLAVGGDSSKCKRQNFEEDFYLMAGVPIEFKTEKFFINRDKKKELEIFDMLDLKPHEYIFVHDGDNNTKDKTNLKFIRNDMKIVKPVGFGLFDWMHVIENAREIHCIDSSFLCLIDCMDTYEIELYNHRYIKNYPNDIKIFTNKNWNFL